MNACSLMAQSPLPDSGNTTRAVPDQAIVAVPENPWLICIVDDDDSVRKGLSRLMRASGFEVRAYATPESFLTTARAESRTCVLMDITMPRISGLQLQERLKEKGIDLPIIAVSARDDEDTRDSARKLGARFFLRKPVDDQALLDAIRWITGAGT